MDIFERYREMELVRLVIDWMWGKEVKERVILRMIFRFFICVIWIGRILFTEVGKIGIMLGEKRIKKLVLDMLR